MKRLILILIFIVLVARPCLGAIDPSIDNKKTYKNAYRWTGKPKDKLLDWAVAMEDAVDGTTGVPSLYFSGLTTVVGEALTTEGTLFYDSDTSNLKYYTSSWQTIAASTSSTLDEAYSAGQGITVDAGALTLTTTDAANNAAFAIVHVETGAYPAFEISNAGTDPTIEITTSGTGADITGTSALWSISKVGAATLVGITNTGTVNHDSANVFFDATDTGKDLEWDDSQETLHFLDNCILGIGGATTAAADFAIMHDATDVDVIPAAVTAIWKWGDGTNDIDMWWYGSAAGDYMLWDEGAAELTFIDAHIGLADDGTIVFGTGNDWSAYSSTGKKLNFTPTDTDGSASFDIGANTAGADFQLFGADTSGAYCLWDSSNDALWFDKADIALGETDYILFGDTMGTGDFSMGASANNVLSITQTSDGTGAVLFSADGEGMDVTWYGDTASSFMHWDEDYGTNGSLLFDVTNLHLGDGDELQFGDLANDGDFTISDESDVWTFAQGTADTGTVTWGADNAGMDCTWFGERTSAFLKWDATSADQLILTGVDSSGTLFAITGVDTTGDTDTVTLAHDGDGDAIQMTLAAPASVGLNIIGDAAGTHSQINIDLETGAWVGAATTGAIEVTNDGLLVADASLLRLENKGQIAVANDGACLEVIDSGAARATSYAVRIASTSNEAMHVDAGLVVIDEGLTIGTTLTVAGNSTLSGDITGDGGDQLTGYGRSVLVQTDAAETLTIAQSGTIFYSLAAQGIWTLDLPDAQAGIWYTVVDVSAAGADDVHIDPQGGDTIDGDAAGDGLSNTADEAAAVINIFAVDGVQWFTTGATGTWVAD